MNPNLMFQIITLALSVVKLQAEGNVPKGELVASIILTIIQTGADAYRQHTGEALDLALIKAEETI